ncbi:A-kinase anchor protein 12 isoform X5 [Mixophyes fleayi]|uniref:A-kinase anchor protein 12 isoform X5 n=1 Tax=Mixophyes fleayi TaxID=3061075 RepID=UPI003F4E2C5E
MGAGTSAEQVTEKPNEEQIEQSNDLGQQELDGQEVEVEAEGDAKILHKNGKIAVMNGTGEEEGAMEAGIQAEDINGLQEDVVIEVVEQQDPANVMLDMEPAENMGVAHNDTPPKDIAKEDGQVDTTDATDTTNVSEEKVESPEQANEDHSNEVGFKKVFSFVGFKFTVKKDKTEKSEPVQLLTVKKDEVEVNGTDSHEEHIDAADEGKTETQLETKDVEQQAESEDGLAQPAESPVETPNEKQKKAEEAEVEKDQKSPESPTNSVVTDTSSPFKRFFTQGWAGLRKKTSFKKSKEEDPQEVEKYIKSEEQEKAQAPEAVKEEEAAEKESTENAPVPEDLSKSASEESKESFEENITIVAEVELKPEESSSDEPKELKLEETIKAEESFVAINTESSPEVGEIAPEPNVLSEIIAEADTLDAKLENQKADEITAAIPPTAEEINEPLPLVASEPGALESEQPQLTSSTECAELEKSQEVITTEAELLSSQEKAKVQGSPLKKLFSSSGLRKLSGKKRKGKKENDTKVEVATEPAPVSSESSDAPEGDGGDSSPSSPEEAAETSPTEKTLEDAPQAAETEGEGATSDGERKKDGITPWASFKKLVTPKRRPKRPSESDKEDEVEKVKSLTMSSTESAGSVENQEETKETKENVDEQKLEKSTEENKKKVDSSVSWEALICVGSSKKRARKTSDSDEEEIQKSQEESKKIEEVVQATEIDSDSPITSSQEQQIQESPSPDQANSPTEADGVSTWQSFKRLVTPRRKSRTRAEDKGEETAVVVNAEQSTSEGEASKEESWVPFRKLIPGRKKKKSDSKQEHTVNNETDQPVNEAAEDDYDEPAVVPLSEFDAAEQEKLDAQKSLEESIPIDVFGEKQGSSEKPSEELIHAVTVTVIEGERAVTSLEERSPSWISAKVSETIEHAKKTEEITDRIKTEVTVEEAFVFSTVSQVMAETQHTLINEMELTSEAISALEEAIENSCAEETTEMVSAVSQLGESVVSTDEATPVPEEDASMQNIEEQKKHTDNILYAAAERAKLSIDALEAEKSSTDIITDISPNLQCEVNVDILKIEDPLYLQEKIVIIESEQITVAETRTEESNTILNKELCPDSTREHTHEFVLISADGQIDPNTVKEVLLKSPQNISDECLPTSLDESVPVKAIEKVCESFAVCVGKETNGEDQGHKRILVSAEEAIEDTYVSVIKKTVENVMEQKGDQVLIAATEQFVVHVSAKKQDKENASISAEELAYESAPLVAIEKSSGDPVLEEILESDDVQAEKRLSSLTKEQLDKSYLVVEEQATKQKINENYTVFIDVHSEEAAPLLMDRQDEEAVTIQKEEHVLASSDVQAEEAVSLSTDVQADEGVPVSVDVQADKGVPVSADVQADEGVPGSADLHTDKGVPVSADVQTDQGVPVSTDVQADEGVAVSADVQADEGVPVPADVQADEGVPVSADEGVHVSADLYEDEGVPVSSDVQADEGVHVSVDVQEDEGVHLSVDVQADEGVPVYADVQEDEGVPVSAELKEDEGVHVSSDVQEDEGVPVSSDVQADEGVPVSFDMQAEEIAPVSVDVPAQEYVPVAFEGQSEVSVPEKKLEGVLLAVELQKDEDVIAVLPIVPSVPEVKTEESVPSVPEVKTEESVPSVPEVKTEESVPSVPEVQTEESVPSVPEVQTEKRFPSVPEVQTEESVPSVPEVQTEERVPSVPEVQTEESVPSVPEMQTEESVPSVPEMQTEESVPSVPEVQTEESVPSVPEVQTEESVPSVPEVQTEESVYSVPEVQTEESVPSVPEVQTEESVPSVPEVQTEESVPSVPEVQTEESVPSVPEVQIEESVPSVPEVQTEESVPSVPEVQTEESVPSVPEVQTEESVPSVPEVQTEESVPSVPEVKTEESVLSVPEVQTEESVPSVSEVKTEESVPSVPEVQTEESVPSVSEVKTEESVPSLPEVQTEESVPSVSEKSVSNLVKDVQEGASVWCGEVGLMSADESICIPTECEGSGSVKQETSGSSYVTEKETQESFSIKKEVIKEGTSMTDLLVAEQEIPLCASSSFLSENVVTTETNVITVADHHLGSTCTKIDLAKGSEEECKRKEYGNKDEGGAIKSVTVVDQLTLGHEEVAEVKEEVVATDIPELESSEASNASEPVAAVEEQVLAETVKPIQTTGDSIEVVQLADATRSECNEETSKGLQTAVETVSQKAAAIVDAAIEAATNCFIVDATSNGDTLEEATVIENGDLTEETVVQATCIELHSTTIVQNIIETAMEKVVAVVHNNESVSMTQGQIQEYEIVSQVQETVPVCEPITVVNTTAYRELQDAGGVDDPQKEVFVIRVELQTKGNPKEEIKAELQKNEACGLLKDGDDLTQCRDLVDQESAQLVQNTDEESKHSVPNYIQEENIQETSCHTAASEVNTQEKSQNVES